MSEANKPFVVTDRRKFTLDGDLRPDADPSPEREAPLPVPPPPPPPPAAEAANAEPDAETEEDSLPPGPTAEQMEQSRIAYQATADRLDTAIRAADPGADHPPPMNFEQLVQFIHMTAIMQMGGGTPEGQQPRVDLLGGRQSVDMLTVLSEKITGNLSPDEQRFVDSALFDARLAFLEVTQALARSAAAKGPPPSGPSIVR